MQSNYKVIKKQSSLAISELEIIRVILNDQHIALSDENAVAKAQAVIQPILNQYYLNNILPDTIVAQLLALATHYSSHKNPFRAELSLNYAKSSSTYPLHLAARQGNLVEIKKLINTGHKINETDVFGSTALHMAAMYGHEEVARYLLSHGAKINAQTYIGIDNLGYTAVDLAVKYAPDLKTLTTLLEKGGQPAHWDRLLETLIDDVFESILLSDFAAFSLTLSKLDTLALGNKNALWVNVEELTPVYVILQEIAGFTPNELFYQRISNSIEVFLAQDINHFSDNFLLAKNLLSLFPSDKEYFFNIDGKIAPMLASGHYSSFTTHSIVKLLDKYHSLMSTMLDYDLYAKYKKKFSYFQSLDEYTAIKETAFIELENAFKLGNMLCHKGGMREVSEMLMEKYLAGQTIIIPTGWWGHAIDIIIDSQLNLFMVANAGDSFPLLPHGLSAYNMQFDLTVDDIYGVLNNYDKIDQEFKRFYDLGLTYNEEYTFETAPQIYGNCAWNSQLISEQALLYISLSKTTGNSALAFQIASDWFTQLNEFQKTEILKEFLESPALEIAALGDILVHYHSTLKTPSEVERATMILDYLTLNENKTEFKRYCKFHQHEFSPDLTKFIDDNGYHYHQQKDQSKHHPIFQMADAENSEVLKITDVLNFSEENELFVDHIAATPVVTLAPTLETTLEPVALSIITTPQLILHEEQSIMVF